jgi:hypothetical protein
MVVAELLVHDFKFQASKKSRNKHDGSSNMRYPGRVSLVPIFLVLFHHLYPIPQFFAHRGAKTISNRC